MTFCDQNHVENIRLPKKKLNNVKRNCDYSEKSQRYTVSSVQTGVLRIRGRVADSAMAELMCYPASYAECMGLIDRHGVPHGKIVLVCYNHTESRFSVINNTKQA